MSNNENPGDESVCDQPLPKSVERAVAERRLPEVLDKMRREQVELEELRARVLAMVRAYTHRQIQLSRDGVDPEMAHEQAHDHALAITGESERFWNDWGDWNKMAGWPLKSKRLGIRIAYMERQNAMPVVLREFPGGFVVINPPAARVWVILNRNATDETCQKLRAAGFGRRKTTKRSWWQEYSDKAISAALTFAGLPPEGVGEGSRETQAPAASWHPAPRPAVVHTGCAAVVLNQCDCDYVRRIAAGNTPTPAPLPIMPLSSAVRA